MKVPREIIAIIAAIVIGYLINEWKQSKIAEMDAYPIDFAQVPKKKFIVTGGNSGLGYDTAKELAKAGGTVILACRSIERCETAKKSILVEAPNAKIECLKLDLSSLESIRQFVKNYVKWFSTVDVLINNAGLSTKVREVTVDGFESHMGANHFGPFYLTSLLYPHFNRNGKIINHSSSMHYLVFSKDPMLNDVNSEKDFSLANSYSKSKLANLLFTFELNRRLEASGNPKNLLGIAVHPGFTATNLQNSKFPFWREINEYIAMKLRHGALAQIEGKF